jgi:hypothetical protein
MKKSDSTPSPKAATPVVGDANASSFKTALAVSAQLEETMKGLAATARNTSNPMDLLRALLKIVPLNLKK